MRRRRAGRGARLSATATVTPRTGAEPQVARAVRTYLDHLSVERGLAANTLTSYRRDLRRYVGYLAGRGVDDLDDGHARRP